MKVFVSNDVGKLAETLCHALFLSSLPSLATRWVVVPSEESKRYLHREWLKSVKAVAGVRMITYREVVQRTFPNLPSRLALELRLQACLGEEQKTYLQGGEDKRRLDLCYALANLFLAYLERPREEIITWLKVEGWQQRLWKKVFGETLPMDEVRGLPGNLYFFHPTAIAPLEWEVFSRQKASWFLFSPTEMFLGDFQTEWQQERQLAKVREGVREELAHYFEHDSPLLSNWSVCHRKTLRLFENEERVELFTERAQDSMLHTLQEEWRLLEPQEKLRDASVELHSAVTCLHEVEIVWEKIQEAEGDVVIAVPNLASYTAAIEWVFQRRGGVYTAHGIDAQLKSPLLQGLAVLLSLPHYRFAKEKVEKLLLCPPFLNRFNLSIQEGQRLSAWLEQFGFRYDLREGAGSLHAAVTRAVRQVADDLDFTEVPLLDTWITIALLLEEKLSCLSSLRTCVQWAEFVEDLLATFFAGEEIPPSLRSTVRVLCSEGGEALFPYASIERMLLTPAETGYNISVHGPCFVPLKRGALLPAHTLIVMGLSEGAFPHTEAPSPLAELSTRSRLEEDRGAFLEAVSGAQERLILTYVRVHPEDGKEVRPSSVVEELVRDRRGVTTFHHARAVSLEKPLSIKHQPLSAAPTLDLRLLKKVARHPIQSFFEESLKLTFPRSPSSEFLLSPLDTHKARALSLQHSPSEVIDMLEEEGKIPTGAFRKTALLMLEQELKTYKEALSALRVDPSTLFSLELTPHAKALEQISDSKWVAPPLKDVHGTLDNLTPQGLLYHGDNSLASLLKVWPLLCVASCYFGNLPLLLSKEGEVVQSPLKDPGAALTRYLDYCGKALTTPSPLMPAWGRRLLKEGVVPVEEDDPVLQWGRDRALLPPPNEWADSWRPYLMEVFCDLL